MPDSWLEVSGLLLLLVISALGSSPFPVPLTITVLWLGQFGFPLMVVLVATLGSTLGWYLMANPMKRWFEKRPAYAEKIPAAYQQFFLKRTGLWLFLFNAIPFPFEPMRFLAIMNGYCLRRILMIQAAGRMVRYTILVSLGVALAEHKVLLWSAMILLLILPLVVKRVMQSISEPVAGESCPAE